MEKNEWLRLIRQDNAHRIARMVKRIHVDDQETRPFLEAVLESGLAGPRRTPRARELVLQVRRATRQLPAEKILKLIQEFMEAQNEGMLGLLFGAFDDFEEIEPSYALIKKLTELCDEQLQVVRKGKNVTPVFFTVLMLMAASAMGKTHTWSNALKRMQETNNFSLLLLLLEQMAQGNLALHTVAMSAWESDRRVYVQEGAEVHIHVPVPDHLVKVVAYQVKRFIGGNVKREQGLLQLSSHLRENIALYGQRYQDMWVEMDTNPRCYLREEWADRVTLSIPEIREAGFRYLTLLPEDPFPTFRVRFQRMLPSGSIKHLEIVLEKSDLLIIKNGDVSEDSPLVWIDRLLAFVAVRATWLIVTGFQNGVERTDVEPMGISPEGAVVRPILRRLPEGHVASQEAIQRSLATFRQKPHPGFTFVRGHLRGNGIQSDKPLFSLTGLGL